MFVRVKKIRSKRYVYLVEGRRIGDRVRQKTLCYLGPISKLIYGLPSDERFCLATEEGAGRVEEEDASRRIYHQKTRPETSLRLSCRWTSRRDIYRRTVHHGRHRHYNHRQE